MALSEISRPDDVEEPLLKVVLVCEEVSHVEAIVDDAVVIHNKISKQLNEFQLNSLALSFRTVLHHFFMSYTMVPWRDQGIRRRYLSIT